MFTDLGETVKFKPSCKTFSCKGDVLNSDKYTTHLAEQTFVGVGMLKDFRISALNSSKLWSYLLFSLLIMSLSIDVLFW